MTTPHKNLDLGRFILTATLLLFVCSASAAAQGSSAVPRPEHPRPDLMRADWQTLNGRWEFEFDDAGRGLAERWYDPASRARFSK